MTPRLPESAAARPPAGPAVLYLPFDKEFLPWLTGRRITVQREGQAVRLPPAWAPGMHMALIGKTQEGKTTFAARILACRKFVLALDPKGEDDTLAATGFRRVLGVPPRKKFPRDVQEDLAEGRPVRLIVGGASRTEAADQALARLMGETLEYARQSGHWAVYADEFQILADQRMFRMGTRVERMLISAARDQTSVITAFQAPAWVPKAATRQARIIVMWHTGSRDLIRVIADAAGRDWRHVAAANDELPPYHCLVLPSDLRAPMMITSAPKLGS